VNDKKAAAVVNLIQQNMMNDHAGTVKVGRRGVKIPAGQTKCVKCSVHTTPIKEQCPVLFETNVKTPWPEGLEVDGHLTKLTFGSSRRVVIPVHNTSKHDITLRNRTVLGNLLWVKSCPPVELPEQKSEINVVKTDQTDLTSDRWEPPVDLKLHIKLNNTTPVQQKYRSLPRPLYIEVK
jgi:hypothetical protein